MSHNTGLTTPIGAVLTVLGVPVSATFVFRQGAPSPPVLNVFGNINDLEAAMAQVAGPKLLQFDNSISPLVIPAGSWSAIALDTEWQGKGNSAAPHSVPVVVTVEDGAFFTTLPNRISLNLVVSFKTQTVPAYTTTASALALIVGGFNTQITMHASATMPAILVTSLLNFNLSLQELGKCGQGPVPVFHVDDGSTLTVFLSAGTNFYDSGAEGDGLGQLNYEIAAIDAAIDPTTQVGLITTSTSGEVRGSLLYFDGTRYRPLAPDTSGYVLTTHGTGADPTWEPSAAGVRTFLFTVDADVPAAGARFLKQGTVFTSSTPVVFKSNMTLMGAKIRVDVVDAARTYALQFLVNGLTVETLTLPAGSLVATTSSFTTSVLSTDLLTVRLLRTIGAGKSTFSNVAVTLECTA